MQLYYTCLNIVLMLLTEQTKASYWQLEHCLQILTDIYIYISVRSINRVIIESGQIIGSNAITESLSNRKYYRVLGKFIIGFTNIIEDFPIQPRALHYRFANIQLSGLILLSNCKSYQYIAIIFQIMLCYYKFCNSIKLTLCYSTRS